MCFMHPIKPEEAIREAYFEHGIRVFSLDSRSELDKIVRATSINAQPATDLTLCVRIQIGAQSSKLNFDAKFGVDGREAIELLIETRKVAHRLGVCFHLGSQTMDPADYEQGGGFPVLYPTMSSPDLSVFFKNIKDAFDGLALTPTPRLLAGPGRALSAKYHSIVTRVENRRGNKLYINVEAYGVLFDGAYMKWRYKARLLREPPSTPEDEAFSFYGPTCDSLDYMPGPFYLPGGVREHDDLEILNVSAYVWTMRPFNGFSSYKYAVLKTRMSYRLPLQGPSIRP
ncbi:hypothetical protein A1O7_05681 [Cladophialophora yegresii CBS 114405]|uniref:Orn/DAP/Arg decarboxylase 2 N-terminal domain-containing protein n=1 Tax=Cladophialophora yegresii CBS 114405 TaxID=1182544 RepID=W9W159_9EURO|nr:uncharacterized protein A1O7_05681 [Cladophialophora yegresii CBS 114405]EXJ58256.1 hypothetical protein A1O7_05681 [Cladophialophora yegresii CBS 114405]